MKLYDYEKAPNPRRVRMFLAEKSITVPRVTVDIATGENLTPSFLAINPRGVLPVVELDDGTRIDESIAISRYFEELQPDPPLFGTDPKSKAVIESWQRHIEFDGLAQIADAFRNSSPLFAQRVLPGNVGRLGQDPARLRDGGREQAPPSRSAPRIVPRMQRLRGVGNIRWRRRRRTARAGA